ncbi:MAG: ACP S-malonyltransferase [Oscillospiraceae bacterium]|nr:ACP S-malonyltransferase [Oscillospiraceae bacterium]
MPERSGDMGKIAFVFSGQGAQHVGMGQDFYQNFDSVKKLYDACEQIRPGTIEQSFTGDGENLKQTQNTQPCLYLADLAPALALQEHGIKPDGLAGFSLGEIPALALGNAYSLEDGFQIASLRGQAMAKASENVNASMMAVVKIPSEQAEELAKPYDKIFPVNYNSPMQLVFSGDKEQLTAFSADVKAAKGRGLMLKVSGAFHSPYMTPAVEPFGEALENFKIQLPELPVYANYTAKPYTDNPKALMLSQINHPVRWTELIRNMAEDGFDTFIETGVGNTLQKLITQILPDAKAYQVENTETLQKVLEILN